MNPHARKQYQHRKLYNHRPSYNTYTPAYNTIDIPDPTLPPRSPWGNPVGGVWGEPLGENPGGTLGDPWGTLGCPLESTLGGPCGGSAWGGGARQGGVRWYKQFSATFNGLLCNLQQSGNCRSMQFSIVPSSLSEAVQSLGGFPGGPTRNSTGESPCFTPPHPGPKGQRGPTRNSTAGIPSSNP